MHVDDLWRPVLTRHNAWLVRRFLNGAWRYYDGGPFSTFELADRVCDAMNARVAKTPQWYVRCAGPGGGWEVARQADDGRAIAWVEPVSGKCVHWRDVDEASHLAQLLNDAAVHVVK
ncbi:hypothetical protein PQ43W_35 [Ralstonia phage PQ43W]